MFRFLARRIPIERVACPSEWVADGLVHRRVWVECDRPQLSAGRLLNIIAADPNVVLPTEVLQFHKTAGDPRRLVVGDRYLIRMAGPWNGPVIVTARDDNRLRLTSCPGNPQQGHIDFLVQDEGGRLRVEIASGYRAASRAFRALARFLPLVERMEIHTGGHILEMAAQLAGARPPQRIWLQTTHAGRMALRRPRRRLKRRILRSPRVRVDARCHGLRSAAAAASDCFTARTPRCPQRWVSSVQTYRRATAGSRHGDI
jgi:hypothetical protein